MNRRQFMAVAGVVPIAPLAGCIGDDPGEPLDHFTEYLEAIIAGDENEANALVHREGGRDIGEDIDQLEGGTIEEVEEVDDLETALYDRLDLDETAGNTEEVIIETIKENIAEVEEIEDEAFMYYRVAVDGEEIEWYAALVVTDALWWVI